MLVNGENIKDFDKSLSTFLTLLPIVSNLDSDHFYPTRQELLWLLFETSSIPLHSSQMIPLF